MIDYINYERVLILLKYLYFAFIGMLIKEEDTMSTLLSLQLNFSIFR